jgi:HSP20 family protein
MTALTRWNPFEEMEAMQDRLSSLFDWTLVRHGHAPQNNEWAPLIDVIETRNEYILRADLPGVSKSDLSVTLENGQLVIKGQRPTDALAEDTQYLVNERAYGAFTRAFILPDHAEASRIEAEFKQGVLSVKVPKAEKAKARVIAIQGE